MCIRPPVARDIRIGRKRVSAGTVWATPDKPGGYLRSPVLRVLASKIGDRASLPEDFIHRRRFRGSRFGIQSEGPGFRYRSAFAGSGPSVG